MGVLVTRALLLWVYVPAPAFLENGLSKEYSLDASRDPPCDLRYIPDPRYTRLFRGIVRFWYLGSYYITI